MNRRTNRALAALGMSLSLLALDPAPARADALSEDQAVCLRLGDRAACITSLGRAGHCITSTYIDPRFNQQRSSVSCVEDGTPGGLPPTSRGCRCDAAGLGGAGGALSAMAAMAAMAAVVRHRAAARRR
jgi:hypothetical protein